MGFFDELRTSRQKEAARNLTGVQENPEARVDTLEELAGTVEKLRSGVIGEINELGENIRETEAEIEQEREAAAEAINGKDFAGYRAHMAKRQQAEEALTAYQLRLEAIRETAVIPKEDIVALIRSARKIQHEYIADAYTRAAELIDELEAIAVDLAGNLNGINGALTDLERDVLRGDDLYFTDENGLRHPVGLMFGGLKGNGTALFSVIQGMRSSRAAYEAITGRRVPLGLLPGQIM